MSTSPVRQPRTTAPPAAEDGQADATRRLDQRAAYRFSILANLSGGCLADFYTRRFGLTVADWKTMAIIGHHEPLHPGDIAARTSMVPERVSRALDRLVTKGCVARQLDAQDRRRIVVTLSPRGRDAFRAIEAVRAAMEDDFLGVLTGDERAALFRILDKLDEQAHRIFGDRDAWQRFAVDPESGKDRNPDMGPDMGLDRMRPARRRARPADR